MSRLFIGIELPTTYRQSLKPLISSLRGLTDASVNWSRPETWHLTFKFLGETDEARIPAIREALTGIDFTAFPLRAGNAGAFPNERQPRVLWLGLTEGVEQTTILARSIEDALHSIGIPREKKQFRPHLTLGRIRKPAPGGWEPVLDKARAHTWPAFTVDHFTLWQSTLAPTGATHTPIATFPTQ